MVETDTKFAFLKNSLALEFSEIIPSLPVCIERENIHF